jgi:hypothetical protein
MEAAAPGRTSQAPAISSALPPISAETTIAASSGPKANCVPSIGTDHHESA